MKRKELPLAKIAASVLSFALFTGLFSAFRDEFTDIGVNIVLYGVRSYLPASGISFDEPTSAVKVNAQPTQKQTQENTEKAVTEKQKAETKDNLFSLTEVDEDILQLIASKSENAENDKKDADIREYQYINDGVTDKSGLVRVKNVNETDIDIQVKLKEKIDLSVSKDKPSVLIFHTHTTETYQILDRGFYEVGFETRSNNSAQNMVRVGKAICEQIENAGYQVIHDTQIHDGTYSGSYSRSRAAVEEYLKKYPSIQVVLDIHRDAIQENDGTKIKPVAEINGKKAAQIMIISGCQEEGNDITDLPDWEYNLTFAVQLQNKLEELFEGITRPLYFCPRSYNMNLTHCSLLIEIGSDSNTLDEAVYTGKCLGVAVSRILEEYEE